MSNKHIQAAFLMLDRGPTAGKRQCLGKRYHEENTKNKIQNTKYKIQHTRNDYILLPLCHQCQADSHQAIKRRALCHQLTDFQQSYIQLEVGKPGSS